MRYGLPAGLAACFTLCAATELLSGPDATMPVFQPAVTVATMGTTNTTRFTPNWAVIILARPLFRTDRRPLVMAAAVVDDSLPRLSAIVITAKGRTAVFAATDGSPKVVGTGGRIGVYCIRNIAPDSVSLTGPNGAVTVHPEYAPSSASADLPAAPPAPAMPQPIRELSHDPI